MSALDLLFLLGMFLGFRQAAGSAGLQYGVPALLKGALALGFALGAVGFVAFLAQWNLLGFRY